MMKKVLVTLFVLSLSVLSYGEVAAAPTTVPTAAPAKLAEDQIPLSITVDKKTAESSSSSTKALASGLIVIALLGASYYYVRKYKTSNTINKSSMQIKVLTQHYLGPKKSLAIIHVAGESILVGITDSNISMIKSLSLIDDEVPAEMPKNFKESLNDTMAQKDKSANMMAAELDEEFSFAGVTDSVSKKIKSMRRFS
ncbi:MAG: flagellar biosynthetic protein FliO [Bdellovibrionota bacterium]